MEANCEFTGRRGATEERDIFVFCDRKSCARLLKEKTIARNAGNCIRTLRSWCTTGSVFVVAASVFASSNHIKTLNCGSLMIRRLWTKTLNLMISIQKLLWQFLVD